MHAGDSYECTCTSADSQLQEKVEVHTEKQTAPMLELRTYDAYQQRMPRAIA